MGNPSFWDVLLLVGILYLMWNSYSDLKTVAQLTDLVLELHEMLDDDDSADEEEEEIFPGDEWKRGYRDE